MGVVIIDDDEMCDCYIIIKPERIVFYPIAIGRNIPQAEKVNKNDRDCSRRYLGHTVLASFAKGSKIKKLYGWTTYNFTLALGLNRHATNSWARYSANY